MMVFLGLKKDEAFISYEDMASQLHDITPYVDLPHFVEAQNINLCSDLAMIYTLTSRSLLYFNALLSEGMCPSTLIILGDLAEADEVANRAKNFGCVCHVFPTNDINHESVFECIRNLGEKKIIYSGYGGGILQEDYFHLDKSFIHIHAGELPRYRGSTTCYYSLLERGEICASAMLLNQRLDCGDVIAAFSLDIEHIRALQCTDIDMGVEPYIRAKALLCALRELQRGENLKKQEGKGETYYRIHPVLKHLAIFKCFGAAR